MAEGSTSQSLVDDSSGELEELRLENQRLRESMEETARFFDAVSESTSEMYWQTDQDHCFTYMSSGVIKVAETLLSAQLGKTRAELAYDDLESERWLQHLANLREHKPFENFRYKRKSANGDMREIITSGRPIFAEDGSFSGYVGTARDITDEVEMKAKAQSVETIMATAFNALDVILAIWDADDRLVMCNDYFLELNKKIPDACQIGTKFEEHLRIVAEHNLIGINDDAEEWIACRLTSHRNPSGSIEVTRQDNRTILVNEARLEDGSTLLMSSDISAQKQIEAALRGSEQRLKDFVSAAADWFWEMDAELKFNYVSIDNLGITGIPAEEHIGLNRRETNLESVTEEELLAHEKLLEERKPFSDFRFSRTKPDGDKVFLSVSGKPLFDAEGIFLGYRGVGRNITQRIRTEEELIAEKERAENASRAKSEFLAHMSHELRTPLNAIIGFSDIIQNEALGTVGVPVYSEYASDIHKSGQQLLSLINDLLDLSKIEAGKLDLSEEIVSLSDVIDETLRTLAPRIKAKNISISSNIRGEANNLFADDRAITQILSNILSNAEKFSEENGSIQNEVRLNENSGVEIKISDKGCGFDIAFLETAMSPFGRMENHLTREVPGTGLGLPIVNELVALHQGEIDIQSDVGVGTTVTISFPPARTRSS